MKATSKLALALLVSGAGMIFAATGASAACRQVFTNTTCTPGPFGHCTNHFSTVCDQPAPPLVKNTAPPPIVKPSTGSSLINHSGAGLVGNAGGTLVGQDGAGLTGGRR